MLLMQAMRFWNCVLVTDAQVTEASRTSPFRGEHARLGHLNHLTSTLWTLESTLMWALKDQVTTSAETPMHQNTPSCMVRQQQFGAILQTPRKDGNIVYP